MVKHKGKRYGSYTMKYKKVFLAAGITGRLSFFRKKNVVLQKKIFLVY